MTVADSEESADGVKTDSLNARTTVLKVQDTRNFQNKNLRTGCKNGNFVRY